MMAFPQVKSVCLFAIDSTASSVLLLCSLKEASWSYRRLNPQSLSLWAHTCLASHVVFLLCPHSMAMPRHWCFNIDLYAANHSASTSSYPCSRASTIHFQHHRTNSETNSSRPSSQAFPLNQICYLQGWVGNVRRQAGQHARPNHGGCRPGHRPLDPQPRPSSVLMAYPISYTSYSTVRISRINNSRLKHHVYPYKIALQPQVLQRSLRFLREVMTRSKWRVILPQPGQGSPDWKSSRIQSAQLPLIFPIASCVFYSPSNWRKHGPSAPFYVLSIFIPGIRCFKAFCSRSLSVVAALMDVLDLCLRLWWWVREAIVKRWSAWRWMNKAARIWIINDYAFILLADTGIHKLYCQYLQYELPWFKAPWSVGLGYAPLDQVLAASYVLRNFLEAWHT